MDKEHFWVRENKEAIKQVTALGVATMVQLPTWADVRFGLLRRPKLMNAPLPGPNGQVTVRAAPIAWAPAAAQNLGGQYANVDTIRFGQRIYIRVYTGPEIGRAPGLCPMADFHLRVLADLLAIATYASGQRLLASIQAAAGGNILIKYADGLTSTSQVDGIGGFDPGGLAPYAGAPRGANHNVYVQYNPALYGLPVMIGNVEPAYDRGRWGHPAEKPSDVTLFHELIHADDCVNGIFDATPAQRGTITVKLSEMRCVGLDDFRSVRYSENSYRAECGLAERDFYSDSVTELAAPLAPIVQPASFPTLLRHLGGRPTGTTEVSNAQIVSRICDDDILKWDTFKALTNVSGMRNKVKPIDQGIKNLQRHITEAKLTDPLCRIDKLTGGSAAQIRDDLLVIVDACDVYLQRASRETSGRVPGVRSARQAAVRQLLLYGISAGDMRPYARVLTAIPNIHVRDVDGNSQVGLATERKQSGDVVRWLAQQGFDINARHRGLRPIDISRMLGVLSIERALSAAPGVSSDVPDNITLTPPNYVDCLVRGTYVAPGANIDAQTAWQNLWASNGGAFQPILKAAAYSMSRGSRRLALASNDPTVPIPLRVYVMVDGTSTYVDSTQVVLTRCYTTPQATEGGLIHELTHFVTDLVYRNQDMPFAAVDPTTDGDAYITAMAHDAQRAGSATLMDGLHPYLPNPVVPVNGATQTVIARQPPKMNADELDGAPNLDRFIFTLFNRLNGYVAKPPLFRRAPVPVLQEGIVSFTQALHCYGTRVDGLAHSPSVLAYFEGTYLTEVDAWVTQRLTPQGPQPTRPRTGSIMLGTSRGQAPVPQPPTRRRGNSLI